MATEPAVVLVHLGGLPPEHLWATVGQTRRLFDGDIFLVAPRRALTDPRAREHRLVGLAAEDFEDRSEPARLKEAAAAAGLPGGFWQYALVRLGVVEALAADLHRPLLHQENDVPFFVRLEPLLAAIGRRFGQRVAATRVGPHHVTAALLYVGSPQALAELNACQARLLARGASSMRSASGLDEVNEMVTLSLAHIEGAAPFALFPVVPEADVPVAVGGEEVLFDGASWGQLASGTYDFKQPGAAFLHHDVGRAVLEGRFDLEWRAGPDGVAQPMVRATHLEHDPWLLANLHIHSKRVSRLLGRYDPGVPAFRRVSLGTVERWTRLYPIARRVHGAGSFVKQAAKHVRSRTQADAL